MKQWLRSILAIMMALTLTACGASAGDVVDTVVSVATDKEVIEAVGGALEVLTQSSDAPDESSEVDKLIVLEEPVESEDISDQEEPAGPEIAEPEEELLPEDGVYDSKEDVALYIHQYGHLPSNFITKKEAEKLGWEGGSLEPYAPGKCIGGNRFGNYEGLLPEAEGRSYTECDIDTLGAKKRGAKRIVFSNDGLIYYTEDHYDSFELLYGEE